MAKNTSVLEDTALGISCGNSHRDVNTLIQTITFTIDTTKSVNLNIANPKFNAAPWGCHMNNFKILNAKSLDVSANRGAGVLIFHGNNGESDPVKMFKYYKSIGKIGSEWNISGNTNSAGHYVLTLNHGNDNPRIRYSLNLKEVKGGDVIRDLEAGLGYEMSAEILYMPELMQKLKDAGRIEFYFFGRLSNPGVQVGYEAAYLYDFYVDRIGKHGIEFYWVCKSATDPDNDTMLSGRRRFIHGMQRKAKQECCMSGLRTASSTLAAHTISVFRKCHSLCGRGLLLQASFRKAPNGIRYLSERKDK